MVRGRRGQISLRAVLLAVAVCAMAGCQEKQEPTVSLTQEQWKRVKQYVTEEAPKPQVEVGAVFGIDGEPLFELVGYDLEPKSLVTGKDFAVTWHWKSHAETETNYKIFVHLAPKNGAAFQNLDHHPVDNLYQTSLWEPGTYVVDKQSKKLRAGFPSSGGTFFLGFFDERSGDRLQLIDAGSGKSSGEGRLEVGDVNTKNDKHLLVYKVAEAPKLDGILNDPAWRVAQRTSPFVNVIDGKAVDFTTTGRAVYTDDAIYLAFEARDRDIRTQFTKRDDTLWKEDCVEVYLNPDNDEGTYWELQISPGAGVDGKTPIFDAYFETHRRPAWEMAKNATLTGMEVGLKTQGTLNSSTNRADDTTYTLEMKLPFAGIMDNKGALKRIKLESVPPKVGETWRMNFFRVDYENSGASAERTRHASWSPSGGDFHNLDAFGTIEFGELRDVAKPAPRSPTARPSRVRANVRRTRFVDTVEINRRIRTESEQMKACFEAEEPFPLERVEHQFDFTVDVDAKITGIQRKSESQTSVPGCLEEIIGKWDSLKLRPPRARAGKEPPPEPWDPKTVEGELGFSLAVSYIPAVEPKPEGTSPTATPPQGAPTVAPGTVPRAPTGAVIGPAVTPKPVRPRNGAAAPSEGSSATPKGGEAPKGDKAPKDKAPKAGGGHSE